MLDYGLGVSWRYERDVIDAPRKLPSPLASWSEPVDQGCLGHGGHISHGMQAESV